MPFLMNPTSNPQLQKIRDRLWAEKLIEEIWHDLTYQNKTFAYDMRHLKESPLLSGIDLGYTEILYIEEYDNR